ncbi:hypothetical protein BDV33DRAFT_68014 [Aspergillus novoparasiticus]|uniref:Uncharacterized protein n=1 Tax=Aspergillus novoparasiticus TaxID=986946 RepID=A0A5N6EWV2_9EURO|nr:hypothetical protein BDV33DRAFT_68014 [Aspergillus novoparasiticus]
MRLSLGGKLDMRRRGCHHLTIMGKLTIIMDSYGASTKSPGGPAHTIPICMAHKKLSFYFLFFYCYFVFLSKHSNQQYVMVLLCHFSLTVTRSLSSVDRPGYFTTGMMHDAMGKKKKKTKPSIPQQHRSARSQTKLRKALGCHPL